MPTNTPPQKPTPALLEDSARALDGIDSVKVVAKLIGQDSLNNTLENWQVDGSDLGSLFDLDGKLYLVFGDTFGCCIPGTGGPGEAKDWRYNGMAVAERQDFGQGIVFSEMLSDQPGHAMQLLDKARGDVTVIPTNGVALGGRMFLHYMGVREWGKPGAWTLSGSGLAYSDDLGATWTKDSPVRWQGDSNFGQVAFVKEGEYLYLFGIPGGRFGGVRLARVRAEWVLEPAQYEYLRGLEGGAPQWVAAEAEAREIIAAPVGELSVVWNPWLGRWLMTYLDEGAAAIVIREAQTLWGPWSGKRTLVSGTEYPGLYGAYLHPWLMEQDGRILYFTMSQWGPYSVFLMRAELRRKG